MHNQPPCDPESDCNCGTTRRSALKAMGAAVALALSPGLIERAMAGPFERADFGKLVPLDKKLSPQWIKSLFDRGETAVLRGTELQYVGMPVGGLCAGQLYLGGDGTLWHWDIFNQGGGTGAGHYAHPVIPQSPVAQGFSLRIGAGDKTQTRSLDQHGFSDISFLGQYPVATVQYKDAACPATVKLEAFSPFIPLAADDSSLPATVLRFTVTNASKDSIEATLAGWLDNPILQHDRWAPIVRRNQILRGTAMSLLACSAHLAAAPAVAPKPDVVFEDWNKENYDGWTVEGTAFGSRPALRSQAPHYMGNFGDVGDHFVNSHVSAPGNNIPTRDGAVGKLTSKPFTIERNFINFPVGGGNHKGRTCVNLMIAGKVVQSATGENNDRMSPKFFDVSQLIGKQAVIEIVDNDKGPWGNIGVGKITFSDLPGGVGKVDEMPGFGTLALALLGDGPEESAATGAKDGFDGNGADASAKLGESLVGSIGRKLTLAPGQSATVDFVLTWRFPNLQLKGLGKVGRHYATRFDSAQAVAQYVCDHFKRLTSQTILWRDTWHDSTLPHWFLDRTFLNACILATGTCFRFADGRFYAWEGVGCCPGTCTHVWHYAQTMSRLFPELERITREHVDLAISFNPSTGVMGFRGEFDRGLAVDGQAGTILRCYREHLMSADDSFLRRNWPRIKQAFSPLLKLDGDDDGLMEGAQMNTLDEPWYGKVAWLSGLYVAAIHAGAAMAREMGDQAFAARCKAIAERGSKNIVEQLFDGEYFINKVNPQKLDAINSGTGCEIDQVLGQSWAWQVGLDRVLPAEQTRSALRSLWKYNFTPDVGPYRQKYKAGRWYAMPGEAGLLMCSFPRSDWDYDNAKGKGPGFATGYFDECMNGFEHQVAGHMIREGLVQEGLAVERALHDRYSASRRNPWNEVECGDHYSRSMASYGVFLAACGFEYDGPAGRIAFAPKLTPEDFRVAFTAAQGWGVFEQKRDAAGQTHSIRVKWGNLRLSNLKFEISNQAKPAGVKATLDNQPVAASLVVDGQTVEISLAQPVEIKEGQTLGVAIR